MKLSELKVNPNNPQTFDDLTALENSIKEFPKMMELRPLIYDPKTMTVLGGNKRLICLQNLGYKEIPDNWVKAADKLTKKEKKRFILADNIQFGEFDVEILEEHFSEFDFEGLGLFELNTDLADQANINDEWVGMPEFEDADKPFKIIISFETKEDMEKFEKKYKSIKYIQKQEKSWQTRWPFNEKEDTKSVKYESA